MTSRPKFQSGKPANGFLSLAHRVTLPDAEASNPLSASVKTVLAYDTLTEKPSGHPVAVQPSLEARETFKELESAKKLVLPEPPAALVSPLRTGFVPAPSAHGSVPFPKHQPQRDNSFVLNVSPSLRFFQEASSLALQRLTSFTRLYGSVLTTCAVSLIGLLSGVYAHSFIAPTFEDTEATVALSQQVFTPEDTASDKSQLAFATGGASASESGFPSLAAILTGEEDAPDVSVENKQPETPRAEGKVEGALVKVRIVGKSKSSQPLFKSRAKEACPMPKSLAFANGLNQSSTSAQRAKSKRSFNASGFMLPLHGGLLTSRFGLRHGRMHQGVDLAASVGTPISASADGVVTYSGWQAGYGRLVVLQHANGVRTKYAHCHHLFVRRGQHIQQGQTIAAVGNTGHSTGAHLHYEVLVNGVPVNPLRHVPIGVQVAGGSLSPLPTG